MRKKDQITNLEAVQFLRATQPEKWGKYTEVNLLRRYYEAKKRRREDPKFRKLADKKMAERLAEEDD